MGDNRSAALAFDDIGMIFPDGTETLQNISFSVDKGEFVTVVGPSGCGKSTLLKIASGLLEPTAGAVDVDRDRLGYVFQDATLLPWRTVLEMLNCYANFMEWLEPSVVNLRKHQLTLSAYKAFRIIIRNHYRRNENASITARTLNLNHQYSYLMNLSVLLMKSQENTSMKRPNNCSCKKVSLVCLYSLNHGSCVYVY